MTVMRLAMLLLCLALTAAVPSRAQHTLPDPVAAQPEYLYCEIITEADPSVARSSVVFDFGQRTEAWRYNYLSDAEGKAYRFNSGVEALNYMVCRGWEFVQAFVTGEEGDTKHYLLRLPLRLLDETTRRQLLAEPRPQRQTRSLHAEEGDSAEESNRANKSSRADERNHTR